MLTPNAFDAVSCARCHAAIEAEIRHLQERVGYLQTQMEERHAEIDAITARLSGAALSAAAILAAVLFGVIRGKLGL